VNELQPNGEIEASQDTGRESEGGRQCSRREPLPILIAEVGDGGVVVL
jgi:hypothetical protein